MFLGDGSLRLSVYSGRPANIIWMSYSISLTAVCHSIRVFLLLLIFPFDSCCFLCLENARIDAKETRINNLCGWVPCEAGAT